MNGDEVSFSNDMDLYGGPVMVARGADKVLKLLLANLEISQAFSLGTFSSVAGNGSSWGWSGVGCLGLTSFSYLSLYSSLSFSMMEEATSEGGRGKSSGMHFNRLRAPSETRVVSTPSAK